MASFNIIPYLGPPPKQPRSFKKSNATIENGQRVSPLPGTRQVCPGDDSNRPQLVCSFRSSMEPTPAQKATEPGSAICQTQSALLSQNDSPRVECNAQLHCKDDLDSDWICSSRSSTNSAEPLSQISEKSGQKHKRKASMDLLADIVHGKVAIRCLYYANSF